MSLLQYGIFHGQSGFVHGVSNASYGNTAVALATNPEEAAAAKCGLHRFWSDIGVDPDAVILPRPVHGTSVIEGKDWPFSGRPEADIVVSDVPGLAASINSADCAVGIVKHLLRPVFCVFHAGMEGASLGVPAIAISYMHDRYGCNPEDLLVALSPMISVNSYVYDRHPAEKLHENEGWGPFIHALSSGDFAIDLPGFVKRQLLEAGIPEGQIEDPGIDTYSCPDYFSNSRTAEQRRLHPNAAIPSQRFNTSAGLR